MQAGEGAIVNIGSVVGLAPEFGATIYGATKAFVLFLSQGMSLELSPERGLCAGGSPCRHEKRYLARTGIDPDSLPELMAVEELVDAALVGFDRREAVTIPPLHEEVAGMSSMARAKGLLSDLRQAHAAELYQVAPQDH